MKLIVGMVFEHDPNDKKLKLKIFTYNSNEQITTLYPNFYVFLHDIIKSFLKEYNGLD